MHADKKSWKDGYSDVEEEAVHETVFDKSESNGYIKRWFFGGLYGCRSYRRI